MLFPGAVAVSEPVPAEKLSIRPRWFISVAWVTAGSKHGRELALEWIDSDQERFATTGWAVARPDAPWATLASQAAAATSAEVRTGMRVAREHGHEDDGARTLGDLIARLTTVSGVDDIRAIAEMIPAVLRADDAAVSRVIPELGCVEDISRHGWSLPGERYELSDFPATEYVLRTRTAGQVVAGDPASDPAEVRLLEAAGHQALLMVPLVFGGRDVGLLELYRSHAMPWSSGEIERAQLLAHQLGAVIEYLARTTP